AGGPGGAPLGWGRQRGGDGGEPQEDGGGDEVEEDRRGDARALDRAHRVGAALRAPAVLLVLVVARLGRDPLDDAVARDPLRLVAATELRPHGRIEAPEQVEESRRI